MYKGVSQNAQAARDKIQIADLAAASLPEVQSVEDQRRNLILVMNRLEARLLATKDPATRRAMGVEKFELQNQVAALRARRKGPASAAQYFVEECRARMTRAEFTPIKYAASEAARRDDSVSEAPAASAGGAGRAGAYSPDDSTGAGS